MRTAGKPKIDEPWHKRAGRPAHDSDISPDYTEVPPAYKITKAAAAPKVDELSSHRVMMERLKVGETVFCPKPEARTMTQFRATINGCQSRMLKQGKRFTTRTRVEHGIRGVRIWRDE